MKIVLASNNVGKLAELQAMFAPLGCALVRQSELGVPEAPEPYRTFVENALAKARNAASHTGLPALADDAGLCVDAFGGLPGVDTAYYATQFGYPKGDDNNVLALLENSGSFHPHVFKCFLKACLPSNHICKNPLANFGRRGATPKCVIQHLFMPTFSVDFYGVKASRYDSAFVCANLQR